jgi:hypothetical protein
MEKDMESKFLNLFRTLLLKKPQNQEPRPHHIWHLVTNHQNMLYILAAGMVMGPAGFRGKYYSDPLSKYPGWVPLFRNECNIPANFLNEATSERKHLLPCIASFDLSTLTGAAQMLSRNGQMEPIKLPVKKRKKEDIAIFVRAPLPITLLLSVKFCTDEDMQAFKSAVNDVSNVDLISQQVETEKELFSAGTEVPLETKLQDENVDDYFPASGQAIGGMLAILYHFANRSDLGLAAFRLATKDPRGEDNNLIKKNSILPEILSALPNWMDKSKISEQADIPKLFWGVIQALVDAQKKESPKRSIDVALEYLGVQVDQLREKKNKQQLEQLIPDLRATSGLGGRTITELLERHKGSLSRSLLLFFLRENCTELMEFSHKLLDDGDYILAGILFGVRDSWLQLPNELRNPKLSAYVAFRMAEAEHHEQGYKLAIDEPRRPIPLREIFTSPRGKMTVEQKDEALKLARKYHWNDCIETRITLAGSDDLPERFERKDFELVIPGDVVKKSTEVDEVKFLHRLGQWPPIAIQDQSEVLEKLTIQDESEVHEKLTIKGESERCGQLGLFENPE